MKHPLARLKPLADFGLGRMLRGLLGGRIPRGRLVALSENQLPTTTLARAATDPAFSQVIQDLVAYTGFSEDELQPYLLRRADKHFESEFDWVRPRDRTSLTWFYRTSSAYLFANALHPYSPKLDRLTAGRILDYGAGVGCHSVPLAQRGLEVDFIEISRMQADFLRFRAARHRLPRLTEVLPIFEDRFDPVRCITGSYDAIIAMDVLEHIPQYHEVVRHFIAHLTPGGLIIENSPFDPGAGEIAIHVKPSVPLEEAMAGMDKVETGVWRKRP